jgi:hypothetical protein
MKPIASKKEAPVKMNCPAREYRKNNIKSVRNDIAVPPQAPGYRPRPSDTTLLPFPLPGERVIASAAARRWAGWWWP